MQKQHLLLVVQRRPSHVQGYCGNLFQSKFVKEFQNHESGCSHEVHTNLLPAGAHQNSQLANKNGPRFLGIYHTECTLIERQADRMKWCFAVVTECHQPVCHFRANWTCIVLARSFDGGSRA